MWARICLQCRRPQFNSWVVKFTWRRNRLPTPVFLGFCCCSESKESTSNAGDLGSIPGLGRSPQEGHGNPLCYSCLENPHGQRSLADCCPWACKEANWASNHSTTQCGQDGIRSEVSSLSKMEVIKNLTFRLSN